MSEPVATSPAAQPRDTVAASPAYTQVITEIDAISAKNRKRTTVKRSRALLEKRQLAGHAMTEEAGERAEVIEPDFSLLDGLGSEGGIPVATREQVAPALIRAAILRHGSLIVRGLVDPDMSVALAGQVEHAFRGRDAAQRGDRYRRGHYEELPPVPPNPDVFERAFVQEAGGVLAVDSPRAAYEMTELFRTAGMRELIGGYLREAPAFSAQKTTLRKAESNVKGAWHQDGAFLGDVNSLNLWISLSHCGDTAPGMDIIPLRLDEIVDRGIGDDDKGFASIVVTQEDAERIAGEAGIVRPIFEPGDAMFFDHLCLHQTASEPQMPNPRYAIESWFFGPSAFPETYIPLAY